MVVFIQYPPPLILAGVNVFLLTYQIPTSHQNLFSPLIDSFNPIPLYLYSSQPIYPTHILLLTVPHIYITLHGPFYSTHVNLYNLLISQVHGALQGILY